MKFRNNATEGARCLVCSSRVKPGVELAGAADAELEAYCFSCDLDTDVSCETPPVFVCATCLRESVEECERWGAW